MHGDAIVAKDASSLGVLQAVKFFGSGVPRLVPPGEHRFPYHLFEESLSNTVAEHCKPAIGKEPHIYNRTKIHNKDT